jgi:hypothetical protein
MRRDDKTLTINGCAEWSHRFLDAALHDGRQTQEFFAGVSKGPHNASRNPD